MMKLEEYIEKRKIEDGISEFDDDNKLENLKVCVNYVFDYFNNYLCSNQLKDSNKSEPKKIKVYRRQLEGYNIEIKEWLVNIYSEYGNCLNKSIAKRMENEHIYFYLYNEDSEFRELSHECYTKYIKEFPYLSGQEEMIYKFLKEYHRIQSNNLFLKVPIINDDIETWIKNTKSRYGVNLCTFAFKWIDYFYKTPQVWKKTSIRKNDFEYEYDYKNCEDLFNINDLYENMSYKSFILGKKQELEVLLMYYWIHFFVDDDKYWYTYMKKVNML